MLPTDGFVPVSDMEFYLLGKMTQQQSSGSTSSPNQLDSTHIDVLPNSGGTTQRYGHELKSSKEL